jgi:SAM-dependent methyltransferase
MEYSEFSKDATYVVGATSLLVDWFDGKPVPVESRVRLGYGNSAEEYLASGLRDVNRMQEVLQERGWELPSNATVLDFGCGGGRMLRHLPAVAPRGTYWGCDTEARAIAWAQIYLGEGFRLFTNLREPHLPFGDGTLDFVYAGSVFSHLNDMAEFWLLELRRVVNPTGGLLYLTFQDDSSLTYIRQQMTPGAKHYYQKLFVENDAERLFTTDYKRVVIGRDKYSSQVFYKTAWLNALLRQFFSCVELVPNGYGWQTAAVLQP